MCVHLGKYVDDVPSGDTVNEQACETTTESVVTLTFTMSKIKLNFLSVNVKAFYFVFNHFFKTVVVVTVMLFLLL